MSSVPRLLLVEDDDSLRRALCLALSDQGYDVVEAVNGEDAMRLFTSAPHLVLLDLVLGDVEGLVTCHRIRRVSGIPVIVISARTGEDDIKAALSLGADDYMVKPFTASDLAERVRILLLAPGSREPEENRATGRADPFRGPENVPPDRIERGPDGGGVPTALRARRSTGGRRAPTRLVAPDLGARPDHCAVGP